MLQCDINVFLRDDTQSRKGTLLSESMLGFQFLTEATGDGGRPFAEGSYLRGSLDPSLATWISLNYLCIICTTDELY